jgi:hypothetical protein
MSILVSELLDSFYSATFLDMKESIKSHLQKTTLGFISVPILILILFNAILTWQDLKKNAYRISLLTKIIPKTKAKNFRLKKWKPALSDRFSTPNVYEKRYQIMSEKVSKIKNGSLQIGSIYENAAKILPNI